MVLACDRGLGTGYEQVMNVVENFYERFYKNGYQYGYQILSYLKAKKKGAVSLI